MFVTPYVALTTNNDFGQLFSNLLYSAKLSANTAATLTVPGNAPRYKAVFGFDPAEEVWVGNNGTAVLPTGAFSTSTIELCPRCREVKAGDVLNFISANTTNISVAFYAVPVNS